MAALASNYYYNWDYWALGHKVTFDGANKLILINDGVTSIDVQEDIYSDWKEWVLVQENAKYPFAISAIGGDPITGSVSVGITYFLENGWRIKPYPGTYTLAFDGNLYTREPGQNPFVQPEIASNITITTNRSNLVDLVDTNANVVEVDVNALSQQIAALVWALGLAEASNTAGSVGEHVTNKLLTVNKFLSLK